MSSVSLSFSQKDISGTIDLASSKSESNRVLVINALSGGNGQLSMLANARDTETMIRLLASPKADTWDVLDAGTTMRFLTAYSALQNTTRTMTGSHRMCERPIGILVDALRTLGASIVYLGQEGYPPFKINSFDQNSGVSELQIRGDVSSQYISALLMIAPVLPKGLQLTLTGKVGSKPYIGMTLNLMSRFGAVTKWNDNVISVEPTGYTSSDYTVEADWSGASYWYSLVALSDTSKLQVNGLRQESNQGDSVLAEFMTQLGVKTAFNEKGVLLEKCEEATSFEWDFTHCPDIAQTISVICAYKGISCKFSGLESLRIKETDRIDAIKQELANFGVNVEVEGDEIITIASQNFSFANAGPVKTYKDHRMAMAFAPLALHNNLVIENPDVVNKSYPDFWRDLESIGATVDRPIDA